MHGGNDQLIGASERGRVVLYGDGQTLSGHDLLIGTPPTRPTDCRASTQGVLLQFDANDAILVAA